MARTGLDVLDDSEGLPGGEAAHTDVVLLVAAGRNTVAGRRVAENFILGDETGSTELDRHETGVESPVGSQESGQAAELVVHQSLQPSLTHLGQLVHSNCQVVQCLKGILPLLLK